jgi:hypothetical protein
LRSLLDQRPVLVVEQPGARYERRASSRPSTDHGHVTDIGCGVSTTLAGCSASGGW